MEERIRAEKTSPDINSNNLLIDLGAILNFDYINRYAKSISEHIQILNPDKFGAKQTVHETRKVLNNIGKLIQTGSADMLTANGQTLIEAIYPGITKATETNVFIPSLYLNTDNNKSIYPIIDAFLRYSTVPSILVNQGLFETESTAFTTAIEEIQFYIKGVMTEKIYNDFKKYVLAHIYKSHSKIISFPIYLGNDNIININYNVIKTALKQGQFPIENEHKRIYGFNYDIAYDLKIANVDHPTTKEVESFNKLTPAQKVHFIQRHLTGSQHSIFKYLNVNLFNGYKYKISGINGQVIRFNEQQQNMESIYKMFDTAFYNSNPLIRLAALDIIKYAFIVEGYQFRHGNIGKIISNKALYNSVKNGGTGIVDDIRFVIDRIDKDLLVSQNIYEDYIRKSRSLPYSNAKIPPM